MTTFISNQPCLEASCTVVPASEKSTITREDNKILVTFEKALYYLTQALETYEIASFYKKYFVKCIYEAQIEVFKKSESSLEPIDNFKNNLANCLFQEINNMVPPEDIKFNDFEEIIGLSLQCMTIDKKRGELFLVLGNRCILEPNLDPYSKFVCYYNQHFFLVKIDISEHPSIEDWKIIASGLRTDPYEHPRAFYWWYDEWMYTSITSINNKNFSSDLLEEVTFTKEIDVTLEEKPPQHADYKYLDRKYLIIKRKDGSEQYFKSPSEEVSPLIPDSDNEYPNLLPPTTKKMTPGCYFIEKESLIEFLTLLK